MSEADDRLAAAIAAYEASQPSEPTAEEIVHEKATAALDEAKKLCTDACGVVNAPDNPAELEVAAARAAVAHESHRQQLEDAYAEFARTGHALGPIPQAPSNPAQPDGVTPVQAHVVVNSDLPS